MKKRILTTSLFAFLSLAGYAQKEECQSKASLFVEAAKVKNYNEAYEPWKFVYDNCPELYQSTFLYGERILRDKIQQGTDKAKYIKDLQDSTISSISISPISSLKETSTSASQEFL